MIYIKIKESRPGVYKHKYTNGGHFCHYIKSKLDSCLAFLERYSCNIVYVNLRKIKLYMYEMYRYLRICYNLPKCKAKSVLKC